MKINLAYPEYGAYSLTKGEKKAFFRVNELLADLRGKNMNFVCVKNSAPNQESVTLYSKGQKYECAGKEIAASDLTGFAVKLNEGRSRIAKLFDIIHPKSVAPKAEDYGLSAQDIEKC